MIYDDLEGLVVLPGGDPGATTSGDTTSRNSWISTRNNRVSNVFSRVTIRISGLAFDHRLLAVEGDGNGVSIGLEVEEYMHPGAAPGVEVVTSEYTGRLHGEVFCVGVLAL